MGLLVTTRESAIPRGHARTRYRPSGARWRNILGALVPQAPYWWQSDEAQQWWHRKAADEREGGIPADPSRAADKRPGVLGAGTGGRHPRSRRTGRPFRAVNRLGAPSPLQGGAPGPGHRGGPRDARPGAGRRAGGGHEPAPSATGRAP